MQVAFEVTGSPVPKERARRDPRSGRWFTPKRTARYEKHVRACAWVGFLLAKIQPVSWPAHDAPFSLKLRIYFPDRRRRDADNVAKAIQDALNGYLWRDDSQIVHAEQDIFLDRERPRVEVEVAVWQHGDPCNRIRIQ